MNSKSKSARRGRAARALEVGLIISVIACASYFGAKKVEEYREPRGRVGQGVDKAVQATKKLAVTVGSEAPRSFVQYIANPVATEARWRRERRLELDRRIAADPTDISSLYRRYQDHRVHGHELRAHEDLERLIQLNCRFLTAQDYNERAYRQAEEGDFRGALPRAERAVELAPNDVQTSDTLAYIYVGLGRYQDAVDLYTKILSKEPDFVYALWGRAVALRHLGLQKQSDLDMDRALELNPDFSLHWNLD